MKVIVTDRIDNPHINWLLNNSEVKNIFANAQDLSLCHIKSKEPTFDFTNEYVWDNTTEKPIAIFEYSLVDKFAKKFKRTRKIENFDEKFDFKIIDIKIEFLNRLNRFKMFLDKSMATKLKEFLQIVKRLNLSENYTLFFNQNIEKDIYFTFDRLEKSVYLATIADRLLFVNNGFLYLNEFYLIHKMGEKVLIEQQKIGKIDEIF